MDLTNEQMEKLKNMELDILTEFISVCQKMNLRYYILYGTLLGAVRHGGFIPWDDDIDVGMPRKDYEQFIHEGQSFFSKRYFVQSYSSDPEYILNFAKIRDSETTFIETGHKKFRINHGIYIDVFPIDFYPEGKIRQSLYAIKSKLLHFRMRSEFFNPDEDELTKENITKKILMAIAKLFYPSKDKALKVREDHFKSVHHSSLWMNNNGPWGRNHELMPASYYGDGIAITFEGISVNAPVRYKEWLTHMYGDYMKLPPVEKRVTHHDTEITDLEKTYKEYIKM